MLELIVALETEFGIHISADAPMAEITASVNSIVKHLESILPR
jgi:acyl carrier protein